MSSEEIWKDIPGYEGRYIMRKVVGDSYVSRIVNSGHSLCPVRYSNPFVRIV